MADYSQGDFENLRGSRLTDAATALYQATQDAAHKKALKEDYDLSPARLQELQDALAAFEALKTAPAPPSSMAKPPAPVCASSSPSSAPCCKTASCASCASMSARHPLSTSAWWLPAR